MPHKDPEKHRAYQREYKRRWYQENKQKHIGYVRNREGKMQRWLNEYKKSLRCELCGENHPACLEFHHINPAEKNFAVSRQHERPSHEAMLAEIAKCKVLCANCHRKEHYSQREAERQSKKAVQG